MKETVEEEFGCTIVRPRKQEPQPELARCFPRLPAGVVQNFIGPTDPLLFGGRDGEDEDVQCSVADLYHQGGSLCDKAGMMDVTSNNISYI